MPLYEYRCPTNGQVVEVRHGMSERLETWAEVCERAGRDVGRTPLETPVERILSVPVPTPSSSGSPSFGPKFGGCGSGCACVPEA